MQFYIDENGKFPSNFPNALSKYKAMNALQSCIWKTNVVWYDVDVGGNDDEHDGAADDDANIEYMTLNSIVLLLRST